MSSATEQLKKIISWAVALLTIAGGLSWLVYVGYQQEPAFGARWTQWLPTLGLFIVGVIPLIASFIALRNRRLAAGLTLILAGSLAALWLWWLRMLPAYLETRKSALPDLEWCLPVFCLLLIPGLFWLFARGWSPTLSRPLTLWRKLAVSLLLILLVLATSALLSMYSREFGDSECGSSVPPFTKRVSPQQAVFTARVMRRGVVGSLTEAEQRIGWAKYWAVAVVQEEKWGLPWWNDRLVVLTWLAHGGNPFQPGGTYFVDGRHLPGSLTRFLPVYDLGCTRSSLLQDAEIDRRVLHDGPPANGIRILGRTLRYEAGRVRPVPGAEVAIYGPIGWITATSDQAAIYDVSGLPPGDYDVGARTVNGGVVWHRRCCRQYVWAGPICDCTVWVR